jgi:hypothetical protein
MNEDGMEGSMYLDSVRVCNLVAKDSARRQNRNLRREEQDAYSN